MDLDVTIEALASDVDDLCLVPHAKGVFRLELIADDAVDAVRGGVVLRTAARLLSIGLFAHRLRQRIGLRRRRNLGNIRIALKGWRRLRTDRLEPTGAHWHPLVEARLPAHVVHFERALFALAVGGDDLGIVPVAIRVLGLNLVADGALSAEQWITRSLLLFQHGLVLVLNVALGCLLVLRRLLVRDLLLVGRLAVWLRPARRRSTHRPEPALADPDPFVPPSLPAHVVNFVGARIALAVEFDDLRVVPKLRARILRLQLVADGGVNAEGRC